MLRAGLAMILVIGGCRVSDSFFCMDSAQCREGMSSGTCETTGYCSFADPECPSQRRYDDTAAPELAGQCVLGPWSNLKQVDVGVAGADDPTLTEDMLELYFQSGNDIYFTRRAALTEPWPTAMKIVQLSTASEITPDVSANGLTIYVSSDLNSTGNRDIWMSMRPTRADGWGPPTHVDALSSSQADDGPQTLDGLVLMMGSARSGNLDLYVSTRNTTSDVWSSPVELAEIDSAMNDTNPFLTRDGLTLYFDSDRSGNRELYVTSRPTTSATFSQPTAIDELNTGNADGDPWVSRDGHHVFFSSNRSGANAIYEAER